MTAPKFSTWIAACLLVAGSCQLATAQKMDFYVDNPSHDLQFFAPVEFDFENQAIRKECGYTFRYDRLGWVFSGERVTVGDPDLVVFSENVYGDSPFSEGTPPEPFQINNSIQDAPPFAEMGWGKRFELGYYNGQNGWSASILDGPELRSREVYGFDHLTIPNTLPLNIPSIDLNFADFGFDFVSNIPGGPGTGSADIVTSRRGFGSVHVNFRAPQDYLTGFVDYRVANEDGILGPTLVGPGRRVSVIVIEGQPDGTSVITEIELQSGGDGLPDDLDGDLNPGFIAVFQLIGDELVLVGQGVDWGDTHTFNVAFERFEVRNRTEADGVEIMKTVELDNRHLPVKRQNERIELAYGMRFFRLDDSFFFDGGGGFLGRTYAETSVTNNMVGPQVRGRWERQVGRWNMGVDGRMMFAYNIHDQRQLGAIGEDLAPGAVNRSFHGQPHAVSYRQTTETFSPLAEWRLDLSYKFTNAISANLGYTGMYMDNITRASQTVDWFIPDLGILEGGKQDMFVNGVNFGFDVVY